MIAAQSARYYEYRGCHLTAIGIDFSCDVHDHPLAQKLLVQKRPKPVCTVAKASWEWCYDQQLRGAQALAIQGRAPVRMADLARDSLNIYAHICTESHDYNESLDDHTFSALTRFDLRVMLRNWWLLTAGDTPLTHALPVLTNPQRRLLLERNPELDRKAILLGSRYRKGAIITTEAVSL